MKGFHFIFGILVLVVFLLTGQYMDIFHNHLAGMSDGTRMMWRSRHIYVLLAGLLNLGIGSYLSKRPGGWRYVLQIIGSVLIFVSTIVLIAAFFYEPKLTNLQSPLAARGIYAIVGGTILHAISGLPQRK